MIPDRASFTFDIRSASQELGSRAMRMLEELRDKYSKKIEIEIIPAWEDAPVLLDSTGVRDIEELCIEQGLSYRIMTSAQDTIRRIWRRFIRPMSSSFQARTA